MNPMTREQMSAVEETIRTAWEGTATEHPDISALFEHDAPYMTIWDGNRCECKYGRILQKVYEVPEHRRTAQAFLCLMPGQNDEEGLDVVNVHAPSGKPKLTDPQRYHLIKNMLQSSSKTRPSPKLVLPFEGFTDGTSRAKETNHQAGQVWHAERVAAEPGDEGLHPIFWLQNRGPPPSRKAAAVKVVNKQRFRGLPITCCWMIDRPASSVPETPEPTASESASAWQPSEEEIARWPDAFAAMPNPFRSCDLDAVRAGGTPRTGGIACGAPWMAPCRIGAPCGAPCGAPVVPSRIACGAPCPGPRCLCGHFMCNEHRYIVQGPRLALSRIGLATVQERRLYTYNCLHCAPSPEYGPKVAMCDEVTRSLLVRSFS
jgi:hypothetical protein